MPENSASRRKPCPPKTRVPGWLVVDKTGEQNTTSAPARRARRASSGVCAEAVIQRCGCGFNKNRLPARQCCPAPKRAASLASPATTSAVRRARQSRASATPNAARPGAASCRNTTPHRPLGKPRTTVSKSGMRAASLNSQSAGGAFLRLRRKAHVTNPWSMPDPNIIARNLASIRARIARAAAAAGRDPASVTLIAVSKTHPRAAVLEALAAGATVFGENRVQEAAGKFPIQGARLHLIGPLQTNKAEQAVLLAQCIDTLDRDRLADAIAKAADAAGRCPELLVQVNIGEEPQKAGISPQMADAFIRAMQARFGAQLRGLMCIPPAGLPPEPYFTLLAAMADAHGLPVRSMGMSGDFEAAIAAGATHIRVGTAIFGHRD